MVATLLLTSALLLGSTQAYQSFQGSIPNGNRVPHPCKANFMWPGVGHLNRLGGGENNVFGVDFKNYGYWWNEDICRADSDGDGWTNGYELGDPDCRWFSGAVPSRTTNISHPGICDPYNSPECMAKNSFLDCSMEEFYCPAIKKEGVRHINMTFLETAIPPTVTNYYCMTFDLPTDQDYHVIANEPIIDNADVLHHILVYACEEDNATAIPEPRSCGMEAESHCGSIIGLWTVGSPGFCFGENAGFRFGKSAFKRVKLEIHYNNPMKRSEMTDKSGIRLYFQPATPDLEDMVTLTLGTSLFEIPPGKPRYEVESVCKGSCTAAMVREPAKIYGALNHMHYVGTAMMIELFRNGQKIADITNEGVYNYDSPKLFTHSPALDLQKGDEIKTTCVYNSMGYDRSVFYGEATSDEMCYGFVFAYPKNAFEFDNCMSFDELDICDLYTGKPVQTPRGDCYWGAFTHFDENYQPPWTGQVKDNCQMDGFCRPECRRTVERLMEDPCMDKDASLIVNWRLSDSDKGRSALARMNGCRGAIYHSEDSHGGGDSCGWEECSMYCEEDKGGHGPYDGAPKMAAGSITVIVAAILLQYLSA